jgi:hypothetical protein
MKPGVSCRIRRDEPSGNFFMTRMSFFIRRQVVALALGLPCASLDATTCRDRPDSGQQAGVRMATYAYLQESSGLENSQRKLSADADQPPGRLNPMGHGKHGGTSDGRMAANLGIRASFMPWWQPNP